LEKGLEEEMKTSFCTELLFVDAADGRELALAGQFNVRPLDGVGVAKLGPAPATKMWDLLFSLFIS
jgi:hypothetical protein